MPENEDESVSGSPEGRAFIHSSKDGGRIIDKLLDPPGGGPLFDFGQDVLKVAIGLALAKGVRISDSDKLKDQSAGKSWGTAQFDSDQSVRNLVRHIYFSSQEVSDKVVYVTAELLGDWGLRYMEDRLSEGMSLAQILTEETTG